MKDQHQTTIRHIELYLRKLKTAEVWDLQWDIINKIVGMLSLAKALEIITSEEYEHYFEQLYK